MTRWYDKRQAAGFPVLVAEMAAKVVGYASYGAFRKGEGYRHTVEHTVYVEAGARSRGIGRALLDALVNDAQGRGLAVMVGGVSADQPASLALHRAMGFREEGRLRHVGEKHGRSLDLVFMCRRL